MKTVKTVVSKNGNNVKIGDMFGIPLFGGGRRQVLKTVRDWLGSNNNKIHMAATINPEHVMMALKDENYRKLLNSTDLNTADGIALVWARELRTKTKKPETGNPNKLIKLSLRLGWGWRVGLEVLRGKYEDRVAAGSDLMDDLAKLAAENNLGVMYLGGWGKRSKKTAQYFEKKYPGLRAAASSGAPEFKDEEVLAQIQKLRPEILLVAYGMKKQEEWIYRHLEELEKSGVRLAMGVGRSFDYYSGELIRAPKKWRKMGLEWLYSLVREPKRWRRQLALPQFVMKVLMES